MEGGNQTHIKGMLMHFTVLPTSDCLSILLNSNPEMSMVVCCYDKAAPEFAMLGISSKQLDLSIKAP